MINTLKMVVKDLIKQGKTEDEIYNFLSEKYGDWILYKPKFNYENFLLWSFPYLVLVFGGFIISNKPLSIRHIPEFPK